MKTFNSCTAIQHKILYIEDNPSNIRLISSLLQYRPNITLIDARNPVQGLELASSENPDLILLDINLPGMNGYEVLKELRKQQITQTIAVFAVTANAMREDIEQGVAAGFDQYITKPIDTVAFLRTVDRFFKN